MLKLMKHVRYNFHGATMSFLKTHNTLNPFINRSTSNDGWKFSPQAALSPICTMTEESKSIDPSTKKEKKKREARHSQSFHAHHIPILCFRTRVSEELPECLRINLAQ